jgi:hypothetical protein
MYLWVCTRDIYPKQGDRHHTWLHHTHATRNTHIICFARRTFPPSPRLPSPPSSPPLNRYFQSSVLTLCLSSGPSFLYHHHHHLQQQYYIFIIYYLDFTKTFFLPLFSLAISPNHHDIIQVFIHSGNSTSHLFAPKKRNSDFFFYFTLHPPVPVLPVSPKQARKAGTHLASQRLTAS